MKNLKIHNVIVIWMILLGFPAISQVKVEIKSAQSLKGTIINNRPVDKVKGNVIFLHDATSIYCDSAYVFKRENRIEAFGRVRIIEDSTTITAGTGSYDGNTKMALLKKNVVFRQKGGISLFTDDLKYDNARKIASYQNGGRIVDTTNVLTSVRGYYNEYTRMASFAENVVGKSPDMKMESDTMQYNAYTKIVYFRSTTTLTDNENNRARYETGYYNTLTKKSTLRGGEFETPEYFLEAIDMNLDDETKIYKAKGKVLMTAKSENIIITGESADYDQANGITKIYNNPVMKRTMAEGDTLYLRADTLTSLERPDSLGGNLLLAYNSVSLFKTDIKGKADSLVYQSMDSTLHFFNDPVLWTEGSQLTSDTMMINIKNGIIDKLIMTNRSFIISQDSVQNFNQVKGRNMITQFREEIIDRVDVSGNGESIYFVVQEDNVTLTGMNKVICSNMIIRFRNNMVHKITFLVNVEGDFYPPDKITQENMFLKGFNWRENEIPTLEFVLRKSPDQAEKN